MSDRCPHNDKPGRCVTCALAGLRQDLAALNHAITNRDKTPTSGFVKGGAPSWEPISLAALSLLQDIKHAGGLNKVEADLNTLRDPERLNDLQRNVRTWRSRAQLILGTALAPYKLLWERVEDDGTVKVISVGCPVIDQYGDCAAPLRVHREQDPTSSSYSRPVLIQCSRDDDHEWTVEYGGWLRLGVLLGGIR